MNVDASTTVIRTGVMPPDKCYELECELICLKESLQCNRVATYRVTLELTPPAKRRKIRKHNYPATKQVGLTAFANPRDGQLPGEFNERQASALMGIEHPLLNARGKVEARWALDRVAKELGLEWEELVNQIELIAKVKQRIKGLEAKLSN
jgi:hypothetical protein